jgi:hypothetical protein
MVNTCAGIDKYRFYLDFEGVLSSTFQVSVMSIIRDAKNNPVCDSREIFFIIIASKYVVMIFHCAYNIFLVWAYLHVHF